MTNAAVAMRWIKQFESAIVDKKLQLQLSQDRFDDPAKTMILAAELNGLEIRLKSLKEQVNG
jgi:hypothetical protein